MSGFVHKQHYGVCGVFFFQAEDGIRDLVRSRGLGDVYKRQPLGTKAKGAAAIAARKKLDKQQAQARAKAIADYPVSYTHLTLPTSDLV